MDELPIDDQVAEIVARARERRRLVLTAPPGAGKSTRVPPALVEAGLCHADHPRVSLLQPRRVAATGLARRIADERGWRLGEEVGYRIRFDTVGGAATRLWVQTEGTLTRQLQTDPYLEGTGAVILDEFHERSLHADLALAWLRELQRSVREDLVLVVMSATMDAAAVAAFLDAPVIEAGGRPHPVAVHHRGAKGRERTAEHAARVVREAVAQDEAGDVLVFLPGVGEIRACQELLADDPDRRVLPLHGSLPAAEQDRALAPSRGPKVVLATNVAETSITVPGVRTVVDAGLARVAHLNPDSGLDELRLERISRFSAEQRAGRAGRTAPGRCYRLWSRHAHAGLADALQPEVRRVDILPLVLVLKQLHGGDLRGFPWFEPPEPERLAQAEALLHQLGLTAGVHAGLAARGRLVSDLPVHPRLGRLLLEAAACEAMELGATVAALLAERDLRGSRDRSPVAPAGSDLIDRIERLRRAEAADCHPRVRHEGIEPGAAREVLKARRQLLRAGRSLGAGDGHERIDELLPRLVLAGWPDRLAKRTGATANTARLAGGRGIVIEPTSALYAQPGRPRGELLVAHAVQGLRRGGVQRSLLRMGTEVTEADLEQVLGDALVREERLHYDEARDRVVAATVTRCGELDLRYEEGVAVDPEVVSACLAEALAPRALALVGQRPGAAAWLQRYRFARSAAPDAGLPPLEDEVLAELVRTACAGCSTRSEVVAQDLLAQLQGSLDHAAVQAVERLAPERIELPGGRHQTIDYDGERPVLAVRIQECFGWRETPRIADGRVPLLLHLLAPNRRPAQITDDLAGFWAGSYAQVRKDLRGRYPKHAWPEDPANEAPQRPPRKR